MKFTEEQYHEIIKAWESQSFSLKRTQAVLEIMAINVNDDMPSNINKGLALANPVTREWAHDRFVEEEKKYVWRDKYTGYVIYKMLNDWSLSATALGEKHFTETELENSPFKPEWFDKEEVK